MMSQAQNLIWIDLEMTGLDPETDVIIEIATIVTDSHLNIVAEGPVLAINQDESLLDSMDDWNTMTHGNSGLIDRVKSSAVNTQQAEEQVLEFLALWVPAGVSPICGNSIGQDRRFLYRYMPQLEAYFHYRSLDVSTLKILADRWAPKLLAGVKKQNTHQALNDIKESIEELAYYRDNFLRV